MSEPKYQYTHKNHFRFGYDTGRYFCNRSKPDDKFVAHFGKCETEIRDWRAANVYACKKIRENFSGDIYVLFSGGTDSEICIRSFYDAQIKIKVATLRFSRGFNDHDLQYVERLKSELKLDHQYFDLDIPHFFSSRELYSIVDPIECVSPILAAHLWLADQVPGVPVIAQAEPYFRKDIEEDYVPGVSPYRSSSWRLVESERLCSLYKHFIFKGTPAVPGFFQYVPEQFYSYIKYNPVLTELVHNRVVGKLGTRTSKNKMAYQFYPEIFAREKFTGFEMLESLHDEKRKELAERFPYSDENYFVEYNELLSELSDSSELFNQQTLNG